MNYEIYDAITRTTKTNESGKAILADPIITEDGAAMDEIYDTNGFNVASWLSNLEDLIFDAHGNVLIKYSRLRELRAAERGGRLVVLPCKVDTLRRSIDANVSEEVCLVEAEGLSRYGNCHLTCFDCYVNALAKAEAEAALAGKEMK